MRVLAVTGSSGGHIFPARGFLDTLKNKNRNIETLLISPETRYSVKLVLSFKNFLNILKFLKESLRNFFIMLKFQPDLVVGFGALASIPLILSAWLFRIKTLIHEQNVIPGRANKFLAKFSDKIAISFTETQAYLGVDKKKIVLTGNPLRNELKKCDKAGALKFFNFSDQGFTILIMGGSAGSHSINMGFLKAISALSNKDKLQIIHLSGERDYELLKKSYQGLGVDVRLFSFCDNMSGIYNASDLIISRAGATTISEIIFYRLAAIIIPYPFAYKHQLANAKILENLGSAVIIEDSELATDKLKNSIEALINNPDKIKAMCYNYQKLTFLDAGDLLTNEALSILGG